MISALIGLSMGISLEVYGFCYKRYPGAAEECTDYIQECIMDGETVDWCTLDYSHYEQCLKDENKCR